MELMAVAHPELNTDVFRTYQKLFGQTERNLIGILEAINQLPNMAFVKWRRFTSVKNFAPFFLCMSLDSKVLKFG